jgi:hypothetical protein
VNPVVKFARLPAARRRLVLRALLTVAGYRLGLDLFPFRWVQEAAARGRRRSRRRVPAPEQYVWAVQSAARRVPRATCLTQALALQSLLAAAGHASSLRIGVAREDGGRFEAHAWLESGGRILIGAGGSERFTALPTFVRKS